MASRTFVTRRRTFSHPRRWHSVRGHPTLLGACSKTPQPAAPYANMCSPMVVCVLFSRFALVAALEGRRELMGEPVALAPEAGRRQVVGEVSPEGEAFFAADGLRGIHGGSLDGVLEAARQAVGRGARIGCAPGRFSAYAAAL